MKSVFDMTRDEFIAQLDKRTKASLIYEEAGNIYPVLTGIMSQSCEDSLLREWAFQWASETLGIEYDAIYNRWLRG